MSTTNGILLSIAIVYVLYKQYPERFESIIHFVENGFESTDAFLLMAVVVSFLYFNNELGFELS
ncbi:MAG: hypothetical protein BEN18_10925 [Epulopiscium sp. Nuni2H_MBin001]|nr:MAG: hypothetical protein BEN18_10925 [Epulopiscium sp. Nuni2H_MBin001]